MIGQIKFNNFYKNSVQNENKSSQIIGKDWFIESELRKILNIG